MTGIPVKSDMSSIFMARTPQPASEKKMGAAGSFQNVLQVQTGNNVTKPAENASSGTGKTEKPPAEMITGTNTKQPADEKVNTSDTEMPEDVTISEDEAVSEDVEMPEDSEQQEVNKAAEELAGQLLVQLAQELGISVEEAMQALKEIGLTPMDLLQTDTLTQALLQAGGEDNQLSLLTNDKLYGALQNLTQTMEDGISQIAEMAGVTYEEAQKLLEQASVKGMENQAEISQEVLLDSNENSDSVPEKQHAAQSEIHNVQTEGTGSDIPVEKASAKDENQKPEGQSAGKENAQNPFTQELIAQVKGSAETQAVPSQGIFNGDTERIMKQIMDYMKIQVGTETSSLEMQLHPESLGSLHIRISSKEGVVTAQFTTQNEAVKTALEGQLIQLKETFDQQGVRVENIEVTVESHAFERNLEQGNDRGQEGQQPQNKRIRKIQVEGLQTVSEVLTEEDRIAAEIMVQNGNMVDYTA